MKLILGVIDVAYSKGDGKTTGDVAEILENKYHPMEIFYEEYKEEIGEQILKAITLQIQRAANGHKLASKPFTRATGEIDKMFRNFLSADIISGILPITQQITAAQIGVNSRKKSGYNKNNKERPSLIDTGLYQQSFKSWVEA